MAGNWLYSTSTVPGFKEPLQIAALPASSSPSPRPYLTFYCQRDAKPILHTFIDWRTPTPSTGELSLHLNGKPVGTFPIQPLQPNDGQRMTLPSHLHPLWTNALRIEIATTQRKASFLLLNWPQVEQRLLRSCGLN
jgi:hypothetical protein